jgi:tetratricopeptide (TPR) repeat protein
MTRVNRLLFLLLLLSVPATCVVGMAADAYQLIGKIILKERELSRKNLPIVMVEGVRVPFFARTIADVSGRFKFKDLHPDLFTLIVYIPQAGEFRQTVEVNAALADSKRRVFVEIAFEPNLAIRSLMQVSPAQLSIPEKAWKEYENSQKKLSKRDSEAAIAHLKNAVSLAPQFTEAWNTLGTLAYRSGELPLAEGYFREALRQNPDYYPSTVNLGGILMAQGKLKEALILNTAAVQARPDDALAQSQMGLNYYYLGRFTESEKFLKDAISLDPGHFSYPQLPLAEIHIHNRNFALAAHVLKQFLTLHPDAVKSPVIQKRIDNIRSQLSPETPR